MKKQPTENASQRAPVSNKLSAIGLTIVDAEARSTDSVTIAKRIAKGQPMKSAASLGPDYSVDKRREARHKHTNHFTNRAPADSH